MGTRNWLPLTMIVAALCGCAPVDEAQQNVQQTNLVGARQSCVAGGLTPDTPEFTDCVKHKLEFASDRQGRSVESFTPPSGSLEPSSGQLCLPTASGLAVGSCP
jgi:hypothetical protein